MSCDANGRKCANAARRNGISGYVSRYLNTLTNWSTYRDVGDVAEIPQRVMGVTSQFFGLLPDGRIRGVFGVMIATHLVEQFTGAVATAAARMALRGKPFGRYRGITLRESRISPKIGEAQNRLLRGRVIGSKGFYFHESGRTWHSHTATYQVGDTPKTLTHIQSLSWPNREYFFDRELPPQDAVDLALGDKDPDTIPGFIGACNEIDGVIGVTKAIKRLFYFGNWLLVDEMERDAGAEIVDYGDFRGGPGGGASSGAPGYSTSPSPTGGGGGYGGFYNPRYSSRPGGVDWGSSYRRHGAQGYAADMEMRGDDIAYRVDPKDFVGSLWETGEDGRPRQTIYLDGREVPVSIRSISFAPDGRRLADAFYYRNNGWHRIKDERVRAQIAQDVAQGVLEVEGERDLWAA